MILQMKNSSIYLFIHNKNAFFMFFIHAKNILFFSMSVLYQLIHMSVTYLCQLPFFQKVGEKRRLEWGGGGFLFYLKGLN